MQSKFKFAKRRTTAKETLNHTTHYSKFDVIEPVKGFIDVEIHKRLFI